MRRLISLSYFILKLVNFRLEVLAHRLEKRISRNSHFYLILQGAASHFMEWLMRRIVASPDEPNAFECAIGRSYRLVYF